MADPKPSPERIAGVLIFTAEGRIDVPDEDPPVVSPAPEPAPEPDTAPRAPLPVEDEPL